MNMGVQISLWDSYFFAFAYILRGGIAGLYSSSVLNFLRNLYTSLYDDCTNLHSHQWCTRICFSPHPHQHLVYLLTFDNSHPNKCEVRSHCGFDLHFLMISDVEHHISVLYVFFEKMSIQVLCQFLIGFFLLLDVWVPYIFWILTPYKIYGLQVFSLIL